MGEGTRVNEVVPVASCATSPVADHPLRARGRDRAGIGTLSEHFRASTAEADPRSALNALLIHSIPRTDERWLGSKVWYAYVAESVASQQIAHLLRATLQGVEGLVTTMIGAIREPGVARIGHGDDRAVARMLVAAADGLAYRVLVNQLSAREADDTVLGLVDALLGPEGTSRRR